MEQFTDQEDKITNQEGKERIHSRHIVSSILFGLIVVFAALAVAFIYQAAKYFDELDRISTVDAAVAQKVGNWDLPDGDYILKNYERVTIDGRVVESVEIKDKKKNNRIVVFQTEFTLIDLSRATKRDEVRNKILENYKLGSFSPGGDSGTIGKYGEEIRYDSKIWQSDAGTEIGIIGNLNCPTETENITSIFVVILNTPGNYNNDRALEFVNTLKCSPVNKNDGNGDGMGDKLDTDNDGLPDVVEKMIKTDPFNPDSDSDDHKDGDEIKNGHDPLRPRQWGDEYSYKDFEKVKRDINYVSQDAYRRIFGK